MGVKKGVIRAYQFLRDCEEQQRSFTITEFAEATGWKENTVKTYIRKKLGSVLIHEGGIEYSCEGVMSYEEDEFVRLMSQRHEVSRDPTKPELSSGVEEYVNKARESALLAVDLYNRPATNFRAEGFITIMMIAWTALFHAILTKRRIDFRCGKNKKKALGLTRCIKKVLNESNDPIRANLEFLYGLRNEFVHHGTVDIDALVAGECQAALTNFNSLLVEEFTQYYSIHNYLAIPLHTGPIPAVFDYPSGEPLIDFIQSYRDGLSEEVASDSRYCVQYWIIPKSQSRPKVHRPPFDILTYDSSDEESVSRLKDLNNQIVAVRESVVPVTNQNLLKPTQVAEKIAERLGKPFKIHHHTCAWKYYEVRADDVHPEGVKNREYCVYDSLNNQFAYTPKWVDFLCRQLSDPNKYQGVISYRW